MSANQGELPIEAKEQLAAALAALGELDSSISLPLLRTLLTIADRPGISINDIADALSIPQQTASRYVAILQGRYQGIAGTEGSFSSMPLLEFELNPEDPRRRALFLSAHGANVIQTFLRKLRVQAP